MSDRKGQSRPCLSYAQCTKHGSNRRSQGTVKQTEKPFGTCGDGGKVALKCQYNQIQQHMTWTQIDDCFLPYGLDNTYAFSASLITTEDTHTTIIQ